MRNIFLFCSGLFGLLFAAPVLAAETPQFLDSATQGQQYDHSLIISKNFTTTGTHMYLFYAFSAYQDAAIESVTWNSATMTQLNTPVASADGHKIYLYGLADPDTGDSHDAIATADMDVYDGALLLYSGASSTQLDGEGEYGSGISDAAEGSVRVKTSGSVALLVVRTGGDGDPTPGGDAILRASEHGVVTGSFGVLERGPSFTPGEYSVSSTFDYAGQSSAVFSIAPAVAAPVNATIPTFLDAASSGQQYSDVLTITKEFVTTGTHMYLFYAFSAFYEATVESVTWNGATMTQLGVSSGAPDNHMLYLYGMPDPDVSGVHDAVAVTSGGDVFQGAILLYAGASSTQLDATGDSGGGTASDTIDAKVVINTPGSAALLLVQNGTGEPPIPGGDAIVRVSDSGFVTGDFSVLERGPFAIPNEYTVSSTLTGSGGNTFVAFSVAPAVAIEQSPLPFLLDSAYETGGSSTLVLSKNFFASSTDRYLYYSFQADAAHPVTSVEWNGTSMTLLNMTEQSGIKTYLYGLADPDVGASYDAVATVTSHGVIFAGSLYLYAHVPLE